MTYYITNITKQLKFQNFHCSIVCSYCSVVCLVAKIDRIFNFFEIKRNLDSPFNEDPKYIIFFNEALISGEEQPENLEKMGNNGDIYCYANWGSQFQKRISAPTPWYQNPFHASIFLHARQNFRQKMKNSILMPNFDLSLGYSPPKIQGRF